MDLVSAFLETLASEHTRRAYRTDLRRVFGNDSIHENDVQDFGPEKIELCLRTMEQEGKSVSTRRRQLAALRRFFDWLEDRGEVLRNPARSSKVTSIDTESGADDRRTLTKEEIEHLVSVAGTAARTGPRDRALLLTVIFGALRRSDVAGLAVRDVRPLGEHWILDLGAQGYVRVPEVVVEAIEVMRDTYEITGGSLWHSLSNRNRGDALSPDAIYQAVRRMGKQASLGAINIDTLRRSGLRLALKGGADLPTIQAHGRIKRARSAATYVDDASRGPLQESATEWIDLDLGNVPDGTT